MEEIIIATNNKHKVKELSEIFGKNIYLKTLKDVNFKGNIVENGKSFIENSLIKCKTVYKELQQPIIADDSGLCVEALNGGPGILSARYGGKGLTDVQRYQYLLDQINDNGNLNASFVCSLVLYINPNRTFIFQDETKGEIIFEPKGANGFGYDPIFYLPEYNKTMAELSSEEKNKISHRGKAAKLMKKILEFIDFSIK